MDTIKILEILESIQEDGSVAKYLKITKNYDKCNISISDDFQRNFTHFFRVRRNKELWLKPYYLFFEENKNRDVSFEEVLVYMFKKTGRLEPSFSSKLVHIVNQDLPIWDTYVLDCANLKILLTKNNRLANIIDVYKKLIVYMNQFVKSEDGKQIIRLFNQEIKEHTDISEIKKKSTLSYGELGMQKKQNSDKQNYIEAILAFDDNPCFVIGCSTCGGRTARAILHHTYLLHKNDSRYISRLPSKQHKEKRVVRIEETIELLKTDLNTLAKTNPAFLFNSALYQEFSIADVFLEAYKNINDNFKKGYKKYDDFELFVEELARRANFPLHEKLNK